MVPSTSPVHPVDPALQESIARISNQFAIEGEFIVGEEIESGHINSTYRATFETASGARHRYILQRINEKVFKEPLAVMRNVECVTRHINWKVLRVKKDLGGQTLSLYPGRGGRSWVVGPNGGIWRCYNSIEGCVTYDIIENTRQAYQAARAFGSFQDLVSDLPASEIEETIPDFHHTRKRFERLMRVADADPHGRAGSVGAELDFVMQREKDVSVIIDLLATHAIPTRITHNDTKINNVMIDADTDEAVCVIDLDTVMPGASLYDFGDLVRTATSPAAEDEQDLSKVVMQMPMFEALVDGYLDAADDFLNDAEVEHLAFSGKLITFETGMRFLTDFLEGDGYFKIHREGHNLDRCRTQFKLVAEIERQQDAMEKFVRKVRRGKR
ncbi:aminoglycoside phosphotransferase family protein [Luteolibacter flavescens]|uniref:Aminoglycoside phosphotransferase family protein n=1 Tax=Luteolibacter flavescens TaxID=1859460 RepID=A0ABT3FJU2_9BACT|nr:aminoglycoside phosphotransferase family protein [Luteolibacter flavescens]MCW1883805.1 aminoglycoside phosphotransferase family protein [Luteolibacter flavescens]